LIAKAKGPDGFTVEADASLAALKGQKASDLAGTFSWRVVARRNDIAGERLPVWQMPTPAFTKPEPPAPQPSGQAVPDVALAPLPPSR
jgi:hypothetical protein